MKPTSLLGSLALLLSSAAACTVVRGSGDYVSEERTARNFQAISLEMSAEVSISATGRESVRVFAEENLMQYVEVGMRDGALRLGLDDHVLLEPTRAIRFVVEVERLRSLTTEDGGRVVVGELSGDLELVTRDMSRVEIEGMSGDVRIDASDESRVVIDAIAGSDAALQLRDSARCDIAGSVERLDVDVEDTASLRAFRLRSSEALVRASDASTAEVFVLDDLDVTLEDSSVVEVRGNPSTVRRVSDSAVVRVAVDVPDVEVPRVDVDVPDVDVDW